MLDILLGTEVAARIRMTRDRDKPRCRRNILCCWGFQLQPSATSRVFLAAQGS